MRHEPHASSANPHHPAADRVLIIRPTALGDVARTVPVLATLRRALPQAHIDWLVNEAFADAVRHHPALNGVVIFPRKRFGSAWRNWRCAIELRAWMAGLRRGNYDLVVDLQGLLRSGLFSWWTRAPHRVGLANARELGWLGYNRRHHIDPKRHAVDRMLALVEAEGFALQRDMRLYLGQEDLEWLSQWRNEHGLGEESDVSKAYSCLAPTSRWRCKCWPIDHYAQIARRLLDSGIAGERLVILASPQEQDQVRPLVEALGDYGKRVINPTTTVGRLMAILSQTSLLVCNDSAPLHLAVGFDRPIVALFGPTDPALVGPYRRDESVIRAPGSEAAVRSNDYRHRRDDQSLIAQIGVETVWDNIRRQLSPNA